MRRFLSLSILIALSVLSAWADKVTGSTTPPDEGRPEHLYTMVSGAGYYVNSLTAPTQTADKYGYFAFYPVEGKDNAYYIYSYKAKKWLSFTKAGSYANGKDFVKMTDAKTEGAYFHVNNYADDLYEIAPYNTSGPAAKYLNWFQGIGGNPLDGNNTLGLWQDKGASDAGSRWTISEVELQILNYTLSMPEGVTAIIGGKTYQNGDTYTSEGSLKKGDITVATAEGQFAAISINDATKTVTVNVVNIPAQEDKATYTQAFLYPLQQKEVGCASLEEEDGIYTLTNNVLAASFIKVGEALYFAGCKAMDLKAGTEPFSVSFGNGDNVPASAMTLESVDMENLTGNPNAIGGAEHYDGKALVARYTYTYKGTQIAILWRAVLRDGSHYLRTEMELTGVQDVDMYNVIPLIYDVDAKAAGSRPAAIGNTRGKVILSDKIFAGLETPTAYNTVGGQADEEDNWLTVGTPTTTGIAVGDWAAMDINEVPMRVQEVAGSDRIYYTVTQAVSGLKANQRVSVTLNYKSGAKRFDIDGCDLLEQNGSVAASDYHHGYSGNAKENNTYTFIVPNDGDFTVRMFVDNREGDLTSASELKVEISEPKPGVDLSADIVAMQGLWSRNTTLKAGETWKVAAVVGLIAQDGTQNETDIRKTQKRRSFLAYSERERAVPWRPNPCYISWYELNINRNNAAPGSEPSNMTAAQVLDVLAQWKTQMWDKYGIGPANFVIDDGWDTYGTWTFHSGFPNEMKDIAAAAYEMGEAGVGAWLGPVGGYGQSGNYRRSYWSDKGGMQLSNPAYYETFLTAAKNLVENQHRDGKGSYNFFKFDGISGQFSATGPDNGDTGNENAEGIIRLEQYVRENLKEDIFFNTTVGTWASPFWYQITDATWRQENDHGEAGNNTNSRENWITYRDRLVYQNYVQNSPLCPINTLMTHGFILTKFGPPASNPRGYKECLNELRCAFACGSGMVELYNDYDLMNSINGGALWSNLADLIKWQRENADVLMDAHWVGGNPWTGSKTEIYGWGAWNGTKSCLTLRNGGNDTQTITLTLREALEIPANVKGSILLTKPFADQEALEGLAENTGINIDTPLTLTLPGSSVYMFNGLDYEIATPIEKIPFGQESGNLGNGEDTIHDLSGRRLERIPIRGVYIKNHQKVVR